jgi:hypothetical protein
LPAHDLTGHAKFNCNLMPEITGLFDNLSFYLPRKAKHAAKRVLLKKKLDFVGCFYKIKSLSGKGGDPLLERFRFKGSSIC